MARLTSKANEQTPIPPRLQRSVAPPPKRAAPRPMIPKNNPSTLIGMPRMGRMKSSKAMTPSTKEVMPRPISELRDSGTWITIHLLTSGRAVGFTPAGPHRRDKPGGSPGPSMSRREREDPAGKVIAQGQHQQ